MDNCPICEAEIKLKSKYIKGDIIDCPECGTKLEIISVKPFRVDEPLFDDYDDDEDEDWV